MELPFGDLVALPDELLVAIERCLRSLSPPDHQRALAALSLTNKRLNNFFEPILYSLGGTRGYACPVKWAAFNGSVAVMAKAKANRVPDLDSTRGLLPKLYCIISDNESYPIDNLYPVAPRALEIAVIQGHDPCVDWLLQNGANMDYETDSFLFYMKLSQYPNQTPPWRPLFWAIRHNRISTVELMLARGVGPLLTSQVPELKPLHVAAALGHVELFDMLLAIPGCDINDADSHGNTALHYAGTAADALTLGHLHRVPFEERASIPSIRSLLQRGASTALVNLDGHTALEYSLTAGLATQEWPQPDARGHPEPSEWPGPSLLLAAAPPAFVPSDGLIASAMERAEKERGAGAKFLLRLFKGAPLSRLYPVASPGTQVVRVPEHEWLLRDDNRIPLLSWSIMLADRFPTTAAKLPWSLLDMGATPHLADSLGQTPLHWCVIIALRGTGFGALMSCFDPVEGAGLDRVRLEEEAVGRILGDWATTPCRNRPYPFNLVAELLMRGGGLDAKDNEGDTPLDMAVQEMDQWVVDYPDEQDVNGILSVPMLIRTVVKFTLRVAYEVGVGPDDAVKARLVARFGREVLHPDDCFGVAAK
ncbi:hypothetical protein QBC39DRAFT_105270 [Podospora conica]|nr:hypothetical protein QBC39DRAFT_105270 [Schizothecium conicum]